MSSGFLRRGIRASARLVGLKRRRRASRFSHPDSPERARARLFSPLDPDAVEDDIECDDEADVDDAEQGDPGLPFLPPTGAPTTVMGIVGDAVRERFATGSGLPALQDILPGDERSAIERLDPATLLLVDRAALDQGPWAGVEAATGTRLIAALLPLLDEVRARGGQVVLLDHARPRNVNTNLLVQRSDVVLPDRAEPDEALGEQPRSALMSVLQQVALLQTRTSVGEARS